jgi:hypothetical protein
MSAPQTVYVQDLALFAPNDLWLASVSGNGDAHGDPELDERVGHSRWQRTALGRGREIDGLAPDQDQGFWGVGFVGSYFNGLGYPTYSRALIEHASC